MKAIRAIFGTGGFGREVMRIAMRDLDDGHELVFVEDHPKASEVNGSLVLHTDEFAKLRTNKFYCIAVGDPIARRKIATRLAKLAHARLFSIISSHATILAPSTIDKGAIILDGVRLSTNCRIGQHFHANYNAVIGHDCQIGDFVTLSPGAHLNGYTQLGAGASIGTNAALINGMKDSPLRIGEGATIGMGAAVLSNVPPGRTAVGNPARLLDKALA